MINPAENNRLFRLPMEMSNHVLSFLPAADLRNVSRIDEVYKQLIQDLHNDEIMKFFDELPPSSFMKHFYYKAHPQDPSIVFIEVFEHYQAALSANICEDHFKVPKRNPVNYDTDLPYIVKKTPIKIIELEEILREKQDLILKKPCLSALKDLQQYDAPVAQTLKRFIQATALADCEDLEDIPEDEDIPSPETLRFIFPWHVSFEEDRHTPEYLKTLEEHLREVLGQDLPYIEPYQQWYRMRFLPIEYDQNPRARKNFQCANHKITSLPTQFFDTYVNLQVLNLSHNFLRSINLAGIEKLKNLTSLNLSHNCLTFLPDECLNLPNLTELLVSHNALVSLPPFSLISLKNLTTLDFSYNCIEIVNVNFEQFENLQTLIFKGNPIKFTFQSMQMTPRLLAIIKRSNPKRAQRRLRHARKLADSLFTTPVNWFNLTPPQSSSNAQEEHPPKKQKTEEA